MGIQEAIKELNEQKAALDKHIARGGEFGKKYSEALGMGIKALEKQVPRAFLGGECPNCHIPNDGDEYCFACGQALSPEITDCVSRYCTECDGYSGDEVCPLYADKVDEICRIHEEADNA